MSQNYMEKVAQMLGVEMGEKFTVKCYETCEFYITENGLHCNRVELPTKIILSNIMTGEEEIIKIPKRKHTGLEDVDAGQNVYLLFGARDGIRCPHKTVNGTEWFTDKYIRDNWERYISTKKRLAQAASELNTESIQWDNMEQEQAKWYIFYGKYTRDIEIGETNSLCCDNIYFTSQEAAEKAIEIVGEKELVWMLRDFQPFIGYSAEEC